MNSSIFTLKLSKKKFLSLIISISIFVAFQSISTKSYGHNYLPRNSFIDLGITTDPDTTVLEGMPDTTYAEN